MVTSDCSLISSQASFFFWHGFRKYGALCGNSGARHQKERRITGGLCVIWLFASYLVGSEFWWQVLPWWLGLPMPFPWSFNLVLWEDWTGFFWWLSCCFCIGFSLSEYNAVSVVTGESKQALEWEDTGIGHDKENLSAIKIAEVFQVADINCLSQIECSEVKLWLGWLNKWQLCLICLFWI